MLRKHCDSPCFLKCFCVCPPVETSLQKHNLLPEKQKCFLSNSETFHVSQVRFLLRKHCVLVFAHLGRHGETLAGNNVSATMFPSLPKALQNKFVKSNMATMCFAFPSFIGARAVSVTDRFSTTVI